MTDTAPATITTDLGTFEGEPILGISVAITKAGDGLSSALKVSPRRIHRGDRVKLLVEVEAGKVSHVPAKDAAGWLEVRTLEAVGVTFVPAALEGEVTRLLTEQAEAIKLAQEAAAGINRLPIGEALARAHDEGDHASGLVPGCPTCQEEADAVAAELADEPGDELGDQAPPPPPPAEGGTVSPLAGRAGRARRAAAGAGGA